MSPDSSRSHPSPSRPQSERAADASASAAHSPSQLRDGAQAHVFRVVPRERASRAFSSQDNRGGGRWTTPGVAAVYASESPAGAVLEFLAHREDDEPADLVIVSARLPAGDIDVPPVLPPHWRETPYREDVQAFGDEWIRAGTALALPLPSVLCEASRNLLINPGHARINCLQVDTVQPFILDPRLALPK